MTLTGARVHPGSADCRLWGLEAAVGCSAQLPPLQPKASVAAPLALRSQGDGPDKSSSEPINPRTLSKVAGPKAPGNACYSCIND